MKIKPKESQAKRKRGTRKYPINKWSIPYDERLIQNIYSVKGKHWLTVKKLVEELIKPYR